MDGARANASITKHFTVLKGVQIATLLICVMLPVIFRACDDERYTPSKSELDNYQVLKNTHRTIRIDTVREKNCGVESDFFIVRNSATNDALLRTKEITKDRLGFRFSISDYALILKSYLFGMLYCLAATMFIYTGAIKLSMIEFARSRATMHGVLSTRIAWLNIATGVSLLLVILFPVGSNNCFHFVFSIAFFVLNIVTIIYSIKDKQYQNIRLIGGILAGVATITIVLALLCVYNVLYGEWFSLIAISIFLLLVTLQAKKTYKNNQLQEETKRRGNEI
jgi:hypothetical membrane protein